MGVSYSVSDHQSSRNEEIREDKRPYSYESCYRISQFHPPCSEYMGSIDCVIMIDFLWSMSPPPVI